MCAADTKLVIIIRFRILKLETHIDRPTTALFKTVSNHTPPKKKQQQTNKKKTKKKQQHKKHKKKTKQDKTKQQQKQNKTKRNKKKHTSTHRQRQKGAKKNTNTCIDKIKKCGTELQIKRETVQEELPIFDQATHFLSLSMSRDFISRVKRQSIGTARF